MRKLLLAGFCAMTLLGAVGCKDSRYYDIRLSRPLRDAQRVDTVNRDLRLIPYDFDRIFGLEYTSLYDDYPRPNY